MRRVLRMLTLLVSFAALQLTLVSGGPGCPIPQGGAAASDVGMAMADMPGMARAAHTPRSGDRPAEPCDESAAAQSCPTMAPCVFAALAPVADGQTASVASSVPALALVVLTPPSVSAAPELPPPRA